MRSSTGIAPESWQLHMKPWAALSLLCVISMFCSPVIAAHIGAATFGNAATDNTMLILASTTANAVGSPIKPCGAACAAVTGNAIHGNTWEAWAAYVNGFDVEVADDATWRTKTTKHFSTYRAIIFGDSNFNETTNKGYVTASQSSSVWGPAINGSVIIIGADPANHAGSKILTGPAHDRAYGFQMMMSEAVAFAGANKATGAYICLTKYFASSKNTSATILNPFGKFMVSGACDVIKGGATTFEKSPSTLDSSKCSIHEYFDKYPTGANGFQQMTFNVVTPAPYILARGVDVGAVSCPINTAFSMVAGVNACTDCPLGWTSPGGMATKCSPPTSSLPPTSQPPLTSPPISTPSQLSKNPPSATPAQHHHHSPPPHSAQLLTECERPDTPCKTTISLSQVGTTELGNAPLIKATVSLVTRSAACGPVGIFVPHLPFMSSVVLKCSHCPKGFASISENVITEGNHAAAYFTLPTSKTVGDKDFSFTGSYFQPGLVTKWCPSTVASDNRNVRVTTTSSGARAADVSQAMTNGAKEATTATDASAIPMSFTEATAAADLAATELKSAAARNLATINACPTASPAEKAAAATAVAVAHHAASTVQNAVTAARAVRTQCTADTAQVTTHNPKSKARSLMSAENIPVPLVQTSPLCSDPKVMCSSIILPSSSAAELKFLTHMSRTSVMMSSGSTTTTAVTGDNIKVPFDINST